FVLPRLAFCCEPLLLGIAIDLGESLLMALLERRKLFVELGSPDIPLLTADPAYLQNLLFRLEGRAERGELPIFGLAPRLDITVEVFQALVEIVFFVGKPALIDTLGRIGRNLQEIEFVLGLLEGLTLGFAFSTFLAGYRQKLFIFCRLFLAR